MMDKKITLDRLVSYVLALGNKQAKGEAPPGVATSQATKALSDAPVETLKTRSNKMTICTYKPLAYGGTSKTVIELPKRLKKIFEPFIVDTKRHPSPSAKHSLLYSYLYCTLGLKDTLDEKEAIQLAEGLCKRLIVSLHADDLITVYGYDKLGWTAKDTLSTLKEYKNNIISLRFLTDYFNVNTIILNVNEDKIYAVYPEEEYNVYKPTIVLGYCDEVFEPLTYQDNSVWQYNHLPIRKVTHVDKKFMGVLHADFSKGAKDRDPKQFQVGDENLEQYIEVGVKDEDDAAGEAGVDEESEENTFGEVYEDSSEGDECSETELDREDEEIDGTSKGIFCKKKRKKSMGGDGGANNKQPDFTVAKLKKLKLKELQTLAEENDLDVRLPSNVKGGAGKLRTKVQLIEVLQHM